MDLIKLGVIFVVIVTFIKFKKPLHFSLLVATIVGLFLYRIPFAEYLGIVQRGILGRTTLLMLASFYSITFLQRMLEKRKHLLIAEKSISTIFNSRRVNATLVPFIIGLLPSPGAVLLASPIVRSASEEALDNEEQAFVTTYFRHISEAFVPTYASIILALKLSGVEMKSFVIGMLPMVAALFALGYVFYVRKIPKLEKRAASVDKMAEWRQVFRSLWPIILTVMVILSFPLPIPAVVVVVILLNFFVDRFSFAEIRPMFKSAFEPKLIYSTVMIMVFKELLTLSGVVERLPEYFVHLPVQPHLIYAILFFVGTIIVGGQAVIAIILPLAFASIPNAGLGLFILLMSMTYIANQVCPTHICLSVTCEDFGIGMDVLVRKTIPVLIAFSIIAFIYSYGLMMVLGG